MSNRKILSPYGAGLLLGTKADFVLTNVNSEPLPAESILSKKGSYRISRCVGEHESDINYNRFYVADHMVQIVTANSHCRAWSIDNMWFTLKELIVQLSKRAYISFHGAYSVDNVPSTPTAGLLRICQSDGQVYERPGEQQLNEALRFQEDLEYSVDLRRNLLLIVGVLTTLLDRRASAEYRRLENTEDFLIDDGDGFIAFTPLTNFWLYHPALTHLILGAARMACFITINRFTEQLADEDQITWEEITDTIKNSDYDKAQKIWDYIKNRIGGLYGPNKDDNPFRPKLVKIIDFINENGIGVLGPGVYANWRMNRKKQNYQGHLNDLTGWEDGVQKRIFNENHELYAQFDKVT